MNGQRADKAGTAIAEDAVVLVAGHRAPSCRGGVKLAAALDAFSIDPRDRVAMDVGASTGGFTDCLLQRGARRVYAIDVGYGQLDAGLRADPRVVVLEKVNARNLSAEHVPEPVGLATMDLSFISARLVLPAVQARLERGADLVVLVKPQFEAGRSEWERGESCGPSLCGSASSPRWKPSGSSSDSFPGVIPSPIRGARGNQEFLLAFRQRL